MRSKCGRGRVEPQSRCNPLRDELGRVSVGAVREWEQGRRRPEQATRTLLLVIEHDPQTVMAVLDRAAAA